MSAYGWWAADTQPAAITQPWCVTVVHVWHAPRARAVQTLTQE
jgi:hypothetical protein